MTQDTAQTTVHTTNAPKEGVSHDVSNEHAESGAHLEHAISLPAEPVFQVGGLEISNALFTSWLAVFVIIFFAFSIRSSLKQVPGRLQGLFEIIIEGALELCD